MNSSNDFKPPADDDPYLGSPPEEVETEGGISTGQVTAELNYYAILGVATDAPEDEIKGAFRRLSMIFHPDKHQRAEDKQSAERKFHKIQEAYEVLSDPSKRQVYDLFGSDGLESMKSWHVGQRLKTPAEIRAEFERHKLRQKRLEMEEKVKMTQGNIEMTMDATPWFRSKDKSDNLGVLSGPRKTGLAELVPTVRSLQITQATEIDVAAGQTLSFSGLILSRGGRGRGYILATYHKKLSDGRSYFQSDMGIGSSTFLTGKLGTQLSPYCAGVLSATFTTLEAPPMMEVSVNHSLGSNTVGSVTYKTGEWALGPWGRDLVDPNEPNDTMELSLQKSTAFHSWNTSVSIGLSEFGSSAKYTCRMSKEASIHTAIEAASSSGISLTVGLNRTLFSKNNRIGVSLQNFLYGATIMKFRFTRLSQSLTLPFILSDKWNFRAFLGGIIIPTCSMVFVQKLLIEPHKRSSHQQRMELIKEKNQQALDEKRKEAEEAVTLMRDSVEKRKEIEVLANGLVITKAVYGQLEQLKPDITHDLQSQQQQQVYIIDVTIPVQMNVTNSQLHLPGKISKSSLMGFYDPCPWNPDKYLYVAYTYHGQPHECTVGDLEALDAPQRNFSQHFLIREIQMAKHHPDLIMCRKQPGIAIGRLCEKCDGKCVVCDSLVRPATLVRICDECNYGALAGRCTICGGVGISDAYYCKECTIQEKDRDGCPKIINLGSARTDLFYERKKFGATGGGGGFVRGAG